MDKSIPKKFKIFIDFDGTITLRDIGEAFLTNFGDKEVHKSAVEDWIAGKISSAEAWNIMLKSVIFDKQKFNEFLQKAEVDRTFINFVDYAAKMGDEIKILSDGLDLYIDPILRREGLAYLDRFCNKAIVNDNEVKAIYPYQDEECKSCGNCKRNHILNFTSDDDYTVYIGDGNSDRCPAQFCDFIFAKSSLLKFCEKNRISYFSFNNFDDIIERLESLRYRKNLKKRHQAYLKRKEIYELG